MDKKTNFRFELGRQLFHFVLGMVIAFLVCALYPSYTLHLFVAIVLGVMVMLIIPKVRPRVKNNSRILYYFERDHDKERFPFKGAIFYGLGVTPILLLLLTGTLPPGIGCAIIAVLSAGDSAATIIGKFYGRYRIGAKSVEGFLGFVLFSYAAASIFLPANATAAFALALVGGIIELNNIVDDNLDIPLGLALFYYATQTILPNTIF